MNRCQIIRKNGSPIVHPLNLRGPVLPPNSNFLGQNWSFTSFDDPNHCISSVIFLVIPWNESVSCIYSNTESPLYQHQREQSITAETFCERAEVKPCLSCGEFHNSRWPLTADHGKEEKLGFMANCPKTPAFNQTHTFCRNQPVMTSVLLNEQVREEQKQWKDDSQLSSEDVMEWRSGWSDSDSQSVNEADSKLMRRIDWRLLPWMCVLYALSLIDR